jgi:hypothetical protein
MPDGRASPSRRHDQEQPRSPTAMPCLEQDAWTVPAERPEQHGVKGSLLRLKNRR